MKISRRPAAAAAVSTAALLVALVAPSAASAAVPGGPAGLAPNDATSTQYKNLELSWTAVKGATSYEIQVSDDGDFDRTATFNGTSVASSWVVPDTLPSGDYAWRVRAVTAGGKTTWTTGNFTRGWSGKPAGTSGVVEPNTQATNFSWQPIADASFYELQVVPALADGSSPFANGTTAYQGTARAHWTCYTDHAYFAPYGTTTAEANVPGDEGKCFVVSSAHLPPKVAYSVLYLGGRSVQADASKTTTSDDAHVTSYTYAWGDGTTQTNASSALSHTYTADGTYQLTVSASDDKGGVSAPIETDVVVTSTTAKTGDPVTAPTVLGSYDTVDPDATLPTKITPGTYFWRVRGRDGTLDATKVPFAAPALACTGVWNESLNDYDPTTNIVTVPFGGKVPKDAPTPACSNWSDSGSFTINPVGLDNTGSTLTAAPAGLRVEPTSGDPTATSVKVTDTPLFAWNAVAGADKYRVYVSRTADFRDADAVYETSATSLQPVGAYADRSLRTYWTVQACTYSSICGPVAATTAPHSYVKDALVNVTGADADVDGRFVSLSWATQFNATVPSGQRAVLATEAKAYELQAALDGDWESPALDVKTDRLAAPGDTGLSHYTADTSKLADGLYSWRVRPIDQADHGLKWSAVAGQFLKDSATPSGKLSVSGGFVQTQPLTVTFTEPVSNVSAATVKVVAQSTGKAVPGRLDQSSLTAYAFTPAAPWVSNEVYDLVVASSVVDRAGKPASVTSSSMRASAVLDSANGALVKLSGDEAWTVRTSSDAIGKSFVQSSDTASTKRASALKATMRGSYVSVNACRGPKAGRLAVVLDGKRAATLDLYRPYSGCQLVWTSPRLKDKQHSLSLVALPTRNKASKGNVVAVDAIRVR